MHIASSLYYNQCKLASLIPKLTNVLRSFNITFSTVILVCIDDNIHTAILYMQVAYQSNKFTNFFRLRLGLKRWLKCLITFLP